MFGNVAIKIGYVDGWLSTSRNMVRVFVALALAVIIMLSLLHIYIAASYPFADPVGLVLNDEGKLIGLDLNRSLRDEHGEIYDIVASTFLVVGLGPPIRQHCRRSERTFEG